MRNRVVAVELVVPCVVVLVVLGVLGRLLVRVGLTGVLGALPCAGKLGVGAFVDEWISAPYPVQQADRERVIGGLGWLDAQSRVLNGQPFVAATVAQRAALLNGLSTAAPVGGMAAPVAFMDTLRKLFVLGFYSLPEGKADMGHIGDQPTQGPYPGPSREALAHLDRVLRDMKLASS